MFDTPKPRLHQVGPIPSSAPPFPYEPKPRHRRRTKPAELPDAETLTRQYHALSNQSQRAFWQCTTQAGKLFLLNVPHVIIEL